MPDITVTRTTNMRGRELQNAVMGMVQELSSQSPYSTVRMSAAWQGPTRITLDAGNHMRGYVDIQEGTPSRVTANMDLLSGVARMMRDRAIRDINAIADRRLGGTPVAAPSAAAPTAVAPARERREFDPEQAARVTTGIFGSLSALARGITEGISPGTAYSDVLTQYELPSLPGEAPARPRVPTAPSVPTAPPVHVSLAPETAVHEKPAPTAALPAPPSPAVAPQAPTAAPVTPAAAPPPRQFPWGWFALGTAAVVGVVGVAYMATRDKEPEAA